VYFRCSRPHTVLLSNLLRLTWCSLAYCLLHTSMALSAAVETPGAPKTPIILVYGDSLSAGYGLARGAEWPSLLQRRLKREALDYNVINASISGETTAGGRARFDKALARYRPVVLILELGANDGLRGLSLKQSAENLEYMILKARQSNARILLVGMRLPPNYGAYAGRFARLFPALSHKTGASLVDFLLAGIETNPAMFQPDGLHPVAKAQPIMLDNVWAKLQPMLKSKK